MNAMTEVSLADEAVYQEALKRKAQLEAQLRDIDDELTALKSLIQVHERRTSDLSNSPRTRATRLKSGWPKRARNELRPELLARRAEEIIRETGRPMTRTEIALALEAQGISLEGVDKVKNLGTILWRFGEIFESVPKQGYWLKGVDLPSRY